MPRCTTRAWLTLSLFLTACPTTDPCRRVKCDEGYTCRPSGGGATCVPIEGYSTDCSPACPTGEYCKGGEAPKCVACLRNDHCACPSAPGMAVAAPICTADNVCAPADTSTPLVAETCERAPRLCLNGSATFEVDTTNSQDNIAPSRRCTDGVPGRDVAFKLELAEARSVEIIANGKDGSRARPIISFRQSCGTELDCAKADPGMRSTRLHFNSLPAGTYTVVLDSYELANSGPMEVSVITSAPSSPTNERCAVAKALPAEGEVVDLSNAIDNESVSCNTAAGSPDVVYRISLPSTLNLNVLARPNGNSTHLALSLKSADCYSTQVAACATASSAGSEASLRKTRLPAGEYFLFVEHIGNMGDYGPVTVSATTTEPGTAPRNDTCAMPETVRLTANMLELQLDTGDYQDNHDGTCSTPDVDTPEAVYRLEVPFAGRLKIEANSVGGAPTLYLRPGTCESFTPDDAGVVMEPCKAHLMGMAELDEDVTPGIYFLFVESGEVNLSGPTTVTLTLTPPSP